MLVAPFFSSVFDDLGDRQKPNKPKHKQPISMRIIMVKLFLGEKRVANTLFATLITIANRSYKHHLGRKQCRAKRLTNRQQYPRGTHRLVARLHIRRQYHQPIC